MWMWRLRLQRWLWRQPVNQLLSPKQLIEIHDLQACSSEFTHSRRALQYCYAATIVFGNNFVEERGVTGVV
jgi:hypothetical protein